jgi:hypothetical protein
MTICVMSNFHQLTLKPVYINNTAPTVFHNVVVDDSAWINNRLYSLFKNKLGQAQKNT